MRSYPLGVPRVSTFAHLDETLPNILQNKRLNVFRIRQPIVPAPVQIDRHVDVGVVVGRGRGLIRMMITFPNVSTVSVSSKLAENELCFRALI